ncbi:hypothetical protein BCV70DRAFT_35875 [Testicularia cyperi]|uniref:Uncharacterized protein n=1 Tax=Testicularia cyperi TaxID=1882483 RepID=A0A317XKA0_9BASI|nr:hypothetical protein BCV70DRAFT_35875 [Testicularia cyperi]
MTSNMASSSPRHGVLSLLLIASSLAGPVLAIPLRRNGPSVFAADAEARALPNASNDWLSTLQRRAIMKGDEYVPLGDTTVPLTPLLLIFAGLGVAIVGFAIVLLRQCCPSLMSKRSRIILEERERAKQDLRLRGGGSPRGSPTPGTNTPIERRFPPNRIPRRLGHNSLGSTTPSEIMSLADKRPGHGYRGTSFSLAEARKNSDKSHRSSLSGLQLPLLNSNDSSSGSSSFHVNARDSGVSAMSERARYPITATNDFKGRPSLGNGKERRLSFGTTHLNRTSSIGKGADLQRTRSGKRERPEISLHPQAVDRAYATQPHARHDPHSHPLRHHNSSNSGVGRRDSTMSIYEVSSSAEHSSAHGSSSTSRMGSFSMATANPLQLASPHGVSQPGGGGMPWATPPVLSRSHSPEHLSPTSAAMAAATARSSSLTSRQYYDSDDSETNSASSPRTGFLVPSRLSSQQR